MASLRTAVLALVPGLLLAASDRIAGPVDESRTVVLKGQFHPKAKPQNDRGPVDASMEMAYVTLAFKPAEGLEQFLEEQQNPASANYHRWLTPEQFGDRFGLSRNDVQQVAAWLESQGLKVNDVARGRHWITFSGRAGQVGRTFRTEIHRYVADGESHYANAGEPSVPAALAGVVYGFDGLDDFGMQPWSTIRPAEPRATTTTGIHRIAPDDFATIYNVTPLYGQGIDGSGQTIAIVGQSDIDVADIRAFRSRFGLPASDPEVILVGSEPGKTSAEGEADLDIEWAGAVARKAAIVYVYARSVNTAAQYAVDKNLAHVMSMSFGTCELLTTGASRPVAQQANAQGMTWLVSSGDTGAATCDYSAPTPQAAKGATASYPATLPEVTAVGGTEFDEGTAGAAYWAATSGANGGSALSYMPEKAWNDTAATDRLWGSGGGGRSALYAKPWWQTGPGVPDDKVRDLPDVSFTASLAHDPYYLYYLGALYVAGGTSISSPAFAGVVALLNQYAASKNSSAQPGLGNINPLLYRLAQSTNDIFHDITSGDIKVPCAQASPDCIDGQVGYSAGPGYDLATGLGSMDVYQLVTRWGSGAASVTMLTASPSHVSLGDQVKLTATVAGTSGGRLPTGSVTFLANGSSLGTAALAPDGQAASASLTVNAILAAAGDGNVKALYSGDGVYDGSSATSAVTLDIPGSGSYVIPSVTPNPVPQVGTGWPYTVSLTEKAGVGTTLTGFTVDGVNQNLSFWSGTKIAAKAAVSASLQGGGLTPPVDRVFRFTGADADGQTWSQQITVPFVGPLAPSLVPAIALKSTPTSVTRSSQAGSSCPWPHQLVIEEQSGYSVVLSRLTAGGTDLTDKIQQYFGTTRLAPFGTLRAALCGSDLTGASVRTYQLTGVTELGSTVTASVQVTYGQPAANQPALSVARTAIALVAADQSQPVSAMLAIDFAGSSAPWTISVSPANRTTRWLSVSQGSGSGPAQVTVQASPAGLSNGVYSAVVAIECPGAAPSYLNVPVTLAVGTPSATKITGLQNSFSFQSAFAPGMLLTVYGNELARSTRQAASLPYPLKLDGVSATVNGISAPLRYISPGQLNVQIPYEAGAGPAVVAVNNNGQVASYPFEVSVSAPGLWAGALDAVSGAVVSSIKPGDVLMLFLTGEGDVTPSLATGAAPSGTTLPRPRLPLSATIGGLAATVDFAGIPTWAAGVTQINLRVQNPPAGVQSLIVTVGGVDSQALKLTVTQ